MAKKKIKIIMSWSKCRIEVGKTLEGDLMATDLYSIGTTNDKSTSLSCQDGDVLEAKGSGGVTVAREEGEPMVQLTTRVKEMDFNTNSFFTGNKVNSQGELEVETLVPSSDFSVKLTPKNIGATGIKAPCCQVSFKPGSSEEEGRWVDITFTILECEDGIFYREFIVKDSDWADPKFAPNAATAVAMAAKEEVKVAVPKN